MNVDALKGGMAPKVGEKAVKAPAKKAPAAKKVVKKTTGAGKKKSKSVESYKIYIYKVLKQVCVWTVGISHVWTLFQANHIRLQSSIFSPHTVCRLFLGLRALLHCDVCLKTIIDYLDTDCIFICLLFGQCSVNFSSLTPGDFSYGDAVSFVMGYMLLGLLIFKWSGTCLHYALIFFAGKVYSKVQHCVR